LLGEDRGLAKFSDYFLRENPFPETAVIDPSSEDMRINGTIFLEDIFRKEVESLRRKTELGINVVYLSGIKYDKGIGKSALLIHHWRECRELKRSTSLYIRCHERDNARDTCRKVIEHWHREGYLWDTFKTAFTEFSRERGDPRLAQDAVQALLDANPSLPRSLPLTLYTQIRSERTLAENLARWVAERTKSRSENLIPLFESYLTKPLEFPEALKGRSIDPIEVYQDILKFMNSFAYKKHFVFLDQFEDLVMGTGKARMGLLCVALKRMIEVSAGKVILFVTLHPNSETYLRMQEAKDLTGVAPLDGVHRVDVMLLDTRGDSAVSLAVEYFRHFRVGTPPYATFPIRPELVEFMCFMQQGVIRGFLQQLHNCLEYGLLMVVPEITLEFALEHPLEIFGRVVEPSHLDGFKKIKGQGARDDLK